MTTEEARAAIEVAAAKVVSIKMHGRREYVSTLIEFALSPSASNYYRSIHEREIVEFCEWMGIEWTLDEDAGPKEYEPADLLRIFREEKLKGNG